MRLHIRPGKVTCVGFVAIFMVLNGSEMLRTGIPDLLDRSAGKTVRDTVDRVAGSAGHYQRLDRVRSRRSGRVVFVEIVLSFEPGLTIAEVNRASPRSSSPWRMRSLTPTSRS